MANREKPWKAEYARAGRSKCRTCRGFIGQDMLRLGRIIDAPHFDGLMTVWHHADCLLKKEGQIKSVGDVEGLDLLRWKDQQKIKSYIKPRATDTKKPDAQHENGAEHDCFRCLRFLFPCGAPSDDGENKADSFDAALEEKLEDQNNAVWHIKDELKKHVKTRELKKMLEANEQYSKGSEHDLRECCADGMLFGALDSCPVCHQNSLRYIGGQYRCHDHVSEYTECSYSTKEPKRLAEKWRIPPGTNNEYLLEWFDSQEAEKPVRVLPPPSDASEVYDEENLQNLKVAIAGEPMDEIDDLKKKLKPAGVKFYTKVKKDTSCLVWLGEIDDNNSEIKSARRLKFPIVHLNYLQDCLQQKKKLPFGPYSFKAATPYTKMVPVVVTEPVVHEASGLQNTGHILKDGEKIYYTTLEKSETSTGGNSYYILQIIQEDEDSDCYLFRKWGRIGHETIGDSMKEKLPMSQAVEDFKHLFEKKTGNPWESWSPNVDNFKNRKGKYHPVNIDYGVAYVPPFKLEEGSSSQLTPQVKELMESICNQQIYRADGMRANINMDELPLGKLSKVSIEKGLEILNKINHLLPRRHDRAVKSSIIDLSNNFYNVIPSIHPHPILDKKDWKAKTNMLEDLLKIEKLMKRSGISIEVDASLDENYKKLRCDIKPLPQDSDDYKLIEKYFLNTRSPLNKKWNAELVEVFELDREGEREKYASYRDILRNKMLLWHGSKLRNILGILGQGLKIAPKAAPTVGYLFGKGLYFADLLSKSAQYCDVDEDNCGLLFLAEVALGDMYELTRHKYIEQLPEGKHSVKGVGRVTPSDKGSVLWRDQVKVPCGNPTPLLALSKLRYNEYVVYNTAQVKLRFLVKVRFQLREGNMDCSCFLSCMRNLFVR